MLFHSINIDIIPFQCDGKGVCQFTVSNAELGSDPCANVYKYVVIDYECVSAVANPPVGIVTTLMPGGKSAILDFQFFILVFIFPSFFFINVRFERVHCNGTNCPRFR